MKWQDWTGNPHITKKILFYITYTVLLVFAVFNLPAILGAIGYVVGAIYPFLIGVCFAFVVNVLLKFYEERVFAFLNRKQLKWWKKIRRAVCVVLAFLTLALIVTGILVFVLPELGSSLERLVNNAPSYITRLSKEITDLLARHDIYIDQNSLFAVDWTSLMENWTSLLEKATELTNGLMDSVVVVTTSIANGIFNTAMGFIFCVYMLFSKEKLLGGVKRVIYAFLPVRAAHRFIDVCALSNRIFSNFVRGQLTEACIWFAMIYVVLTFILRLPYAVLISTIVALCSLLPIIGPYISMFVACFILLLENPWYALTYLIAFLILQQIEGNLIYPRVVGTSIGLPPIWVLLAILACNYVFGVGGMLLGIPLFSVIYTLLKRATARRLRQRHITGAQAVHNSPPPAALRKDNPAEDGPDDDGDEEMEDESEDGDEELDDETDTEEAEESPDPEDEDEGEPEHDTEPGGEESSADLLRTLFSEEDRPGHQR